MGVMLDCNATVPHLNTVSHAAHIFNLVLCGIWRGLIAVCVGVEGTTGLNPSWSRVYWTPVSGLGLCNIFDMVTCQWLC